MCWMCIATPLGCGAMAWLITGMIFRWRHIGKVCSGDYYDDQIIPLDIYMWKSGKFMQIYFILVLSLCACACVCGCCAGVFMTVAASR